MSITKLISIGGFGVGELGNVSNVILANGVITTSKIDITGNVTGGNLGTAGAITGASSSVSGIVTGASVVGGVITGTSISVSGNVTGGGGIVSRVVTIADATSITMNGDTTDIATQTNTQVAGTLTINAVTGTLANGQKIVLRLQSSNVQTFSWNAIFTGSTDLALPTVSSGSSKYDYVGFIYNTTATKWQLLAKTFGFT